MLLGLKFLSKKKKKGLEKEIQTLPTLAVWGRHACQCERREFQTLFDYPTSTWVETYRLKSDTAWLRGCTQRTTRLRFSKIHVNNQLRAECSLSSMHTNNHKVDPSLDPSVNQCRCIRDKIWQMTTQPNHGMTPCCWLRAQWENIGSAASELNG